MGCADACPYIPGKPSIDRDLQDGQDPKERPVDEVPAIRDDITLRVTRLARELDDHA